MKRMDKFYNETYLKLETAIQELEIETDCPIKRIEAVIHHIIQSLADLKDFVLKNDFKNMEEEIHFFKYQKPVIVSKLIYYNAIYKIETRRPYGNKRTKKYFVKELKKLKKGSLKITLIFISITVAIILSLTNNFLYVASTI